jgi:hypothetical protein
MTPDRRQQLLGATALGRATLASSPTPAATEDPAPAPAAFAGVPDLTPGRMYHLPDAVVGPVSFTVVGTEAGHAVIRQQGSGAAGVRVPLPSLRGLWEDLRGKPAVPPGSGDPAVEALAAGKGQFLGKGDDALAFATDTPEKGAEVVKVGTTVPRMPFVHDHRTPQDAAAAIKSEFSRSEAMRAAGVPCVPPGRLVEHAGRAFLIRPRLTIPARLNAAQLSDLARSVARIHAAGWALRDAPQVGVGPGGKLFHHDLSKATDNATDDDRAADLKNLDRLGSANGVGGLSTFTAALFSACRDERGRWAPCGTAAPKTGVGRTREGWEAEKADNHQKAHDLVGALLRGPRPVPVEKVHELSQHLQRLTVAQLHDLRRHYGLKASGATKAALADRLVTRMAQTPISVPGAAPIAISDRVAPGTYGPSRARLTTPAREADALAASILGAGKTGRHLISCAGVPDDATATVSAGYRGAVQVDFSGTRAVTDPDGRRRTVDFEGTRTFRRKPDGSTFVHNDLFRGEGVGLEMLGREVENCTVHGLSHIETHAAGSFVPGPDPNKSYGYMNGYFSWPRMGYTSPLPPSKYQALPAHLKADVDVAGRDVRGLMATEEGRKWWLKNGSDLHHCTFDLAPGSYSQTSLAAYIAGRRARPATHGTTPTGATTMTPDRQPHEQAPDFSPEDSALLDAVNDRIAGDSIKADLAADILGALGARPEDV